MKQQKAVKIAIECMDDAARKLYYAKAMYEQGFPDQKRQAERYQEIQDAIKIVTALGAQIRMSE